MRNREHCRHCRHAAWRAIGGLRVLVCRRHRRDGKGHVIPERWHRKLMAGEERCELFEPADGNARRPAGARSAKPSPRQPQERETLAPRGPGRPGNGERPCYWRRWDRGRVQWTCLITGTQVERDCNSREGDLCLPRLALRMALGTLTGHEASGPAARAAREVASKMVDIERVGARRLTAAQERRLERARARAERMRGDILRRVEDLRGLQEQIAALAEGRST